MMPVSNLDLLKHPCARFRLPTAQEREAANMMKRNRSFNWQYVLRALECIRSAAVGNVGFDHKTETIRELRLSTER